MRITDTYGVSESPRAAARPEGGPPPEWDWEGRFGHAPSSVFESGVPFEDAILIFITLMAREQEKLALEATEQLAGRIDSNVEGDATADGGPGSTELIALRIKEHQNMRNNLLLLASSISDRMNETLDQLIRTFAA